MDDRLARWVRTLFDLTFSVRGRRAWYETCNFPCGCQCWCFDTFFWFTQLLVAIGLSAGFVCQRVGSTARKGLPIGWACSRFILWVKALRLLGRLAPPCSVDLQFYPLGPVSRSVCGFYFRLVHSMSFQHVGGIFLSRRSPSSPPSLAKHTSFLSLRSPAMAGIL